MELPLDTPTMNTCPLHRFTPLTFALLSILICLASVIAGDTPIEGGALPAKSASPTGASEDPLISNFHSLGEIGRHAKVFRCANPVGNIADRMKSPEPTDEERRQAKDQMQHLYDLGVRTVISLQRQEPPTEGKKNPEYAAVALEQAAAKEVGLTYIAYSMSNKGKNSLQDMSDDAVFQLVESVGNDIVKCSETGGVAFHCKSGKDRTGLVAAYLRIKYQHWNTDQALLEMRQNGHVWKSFLRPGHSLSWHEEHLLAIAKALPAPQ